MNTILTLLQSRWYWALVALLGVAMLGAALYYQYIVGDEPCQVCIQARLWVVAFTLAAFVMTLVPQSKLLRVAGNLTVAVAAIGLAERALYLYRLENGIGDGSCQFQLGMPDWFAVDRWMPWLFEVRNLCSYTPEVAFGFSMAETLVVMGVGLSGVAIWVAVMDLRR